MDNLAQIELAAGVHMPGVYAMQQVTRPAREGDHDRRRRPGKVAVWGIGDSQAAESLAWWDGAFQRGLEVPLAPQASFPGLDEPGTLAVFSDAASEHGTGIGAFAPVWEPGAAAATFVYAEERWTTQQQREFDAGDVSMPMGELYVEMEVD